MRYARHLGVLVSSNRELPVLGTYHTSKILFSASVAAAVLAIAACNRAPGARSDSASAPGNVGAAPDTASLVRGTVASVSQTSLVVKADTGTVTVKVTQPLRVFDREVGSLSDVKDNSFVGVTSVKQPDGSERATEIHLFPDELRGLGEGSYMMTPAGGGNRMTNGAVSASRMTNGSASSSRMSNGTVAGANGSTITVRYAGGSQTIAIPANTPVTEIKATSKPLAAGDRVVIPATKGSDGSLTTDKALLAGQKVSER